MRRTRLAWLCLLLAWPITSMAQGVLASTTDLALTGKVEHPVHLSLAEPQALPPVTVNISHFNASGTQTVAYTGALLWPLIDAAMPMDAPGTHTHLQHVFIARGQDGYGVALAIAELAPDFEGKQVLVAYAENGRPLASLRLAVPGDTRAGRSVHDLVSIEVL